MSPTNPYIGARPFRRNETMYGRARETRDLQSLLVGDRIVLLNSPSGAGKTSLIQAALVPRLEQRRFAVRPTIRVGAASPIPGANRYLLSVMQSLEDARPAAEQLPPEQLAALSLDEYISQRSNIGAEYGQVLIFDQFEEVLTLDPTDEPGRVAFFEQLGDALSDPWCWALFAIREEYVAALEPYTNLVPTRFANTFRLELLGVDAAVAAICGPARDHGVSFAEHVAEGLASDLAKIIVQDTSGRAVQRAGLSVEPVQLQVVCYRLWERRFASASQATGQSISAEDVRALGSIDNALEEYYAAGVARAASNSQVGERTVRAWVDRQLITSQGFRSQVLAGNEASFGLHEATVESLTNAYLVREERRRGVTWLELAHDRLIAPVRANNARWFQQHLSPLQRQAEIWSAQGQPASLLFRDADLAEAETWAAANDASLTEDERLFLENCCAERRRTEERARTARRIRNLAIGASLAAVAALIAFVTAFGFFRQASDSYQKAATAESIAQAARSTADANYLQAEANRQTAEAQRVIAESNARVIHARELAALATNQLEINPERSLLLALRAARTTSASDPVISEVDQILQQATQESRLRHTLAIAETAGTGVAYSLSGQFAAGTRDGRVMRWIRADLPPEQISAPTGGESQVAYSRDGQWLVTGSADGVIRVWDSASGAQIRASPVLTPTGLKSVAISRDNSLIAASFDRTGQVYLLDALSLEQRLPPLTPGLLSRAVAFSPSEDLLATGSEDYVVRLWDSRTGALQGELGFERSDSDADRILALAFSPDGKTLAVGGMEPDAFSIYLWDVAGRSIIHTLTSHTDTILTLAFAPDGSFLASSGFDSTIILWDVAGGQELTRLRGSSNVVSGLAFSPDGGALLSSTRDSTLSFWDMRMIHGQGVYCSAFSRDGRLIATAGMGGTVKLWNAATGILEQNLPTSDELIVNLSISPNSRYLAAANTVGNAYFWDLGESTPNGIAISAACPGGCNAVAFSPDSATLAIGGYNATIRIWDVATQRLRFDLSIPQQLALPNAPLQVNSLSFSPDGRLLAVAAANNGLFVWNYATRELQPKFDFAGVARTVAFSPQGLRLTVAGIGAAPVVYDLEAGTSLSLPNSADSVWRITFSPDGALIAMANDDGTVRTWDAQSAAFQQFFSGINQPNDLAFSPDSAQLVVSDARGFARMVLLNMSQLYDLAASHVSRDLSQAECDTFHIDPCTWQSTAL